jgi:hypothetical protein
MSRLICWMRPSASETSGGASPSDGPSSNSSFGDRIRAFPSAGIANTRQVAGILARDPRTPIPGCLLGAIRAPIQHDDDFDVQAKFRRGTLDRIKASSQIPFLVVGRDDD